MFCSKCGNQVKENVKFCPYCGAALGDEQAVEEQPAEPEEQVIIQDIEAAAVKKVSKGKVAAIIILIFEIALICGVFIFFSTYDFGGDSGNSSGVTKRTNFSYSLNKANKNAELAYGAVREYFDETFHIEDSIAHGEFIGAIDVQNGRLKDVLEDVIDDGYIRILFQSEEYHDTSFVLQWCGDKSGKEFVGQYPDPIDKEYENDVVFGKTFDPDDIWRAQNDFTVNFESYFDYEYTKNGNIIITKYKYEDAPKDVYIPESYNGSKIVAIGREAFGNYYGRDDYQIESVTIPSSVKEIERDAFDKCRSLKTINMAEGVEIIGDYAFSCCGFEKVELPDSVEEIRNDAFYGCDNLREINIPSSVIDVGNYAFIYSHKLEKVDVEDGWDFVFSNLFHLPSMFFDTLIFYEYLSKVIAIGIFVVTVIIMLIIRHHKKKKERKATIMLNEENPS